MYKLINYAKKLSLISIVFILTGMLFLLSVASGSAEADNPAYTVSGYITPEFASSPALNAGFKIEILGASVFTDSNGYFIISNVPASISAAIKVSKENFLARTQNIPINGNVQFGTQTSPVPMWAGDTAVSGIQDNVINMADILEAAIYFNSFKGDSRYITGMDFNLDDAINMTDILITARYFNKVAANYPSVSITTDTPSPTGEPGLPTPTVTIPPATGTPDFGPNVFIADPSMPASTIQDRCTEIFNRQETAQFGSERYAILFKPGTYSTNVRLGFYTQVSGLGQSPDDVTIAGLSVDAGWMSANATCNFWRSCENLSTSTHAKWAVAQAAPFRRNHIRGNINLAEDGWSSGGLMADSMIDGTVNSWSQQQWLSRNSQWSTWSNGVWNQVFVGCVNAPSGAYPSEPYTVVEQTPVIREKPFLYVDNSGKYNMFVPALKTNSRGVSWTNGLGAGQSIPIDRFFIAKPETPVATINAALSQGYSLILTPGIYKLSEPIRVTKANTVVYGLGFATLQPTGGTPAMLVSDVDGVSLAGILFDAGATNSPVLVQVGAPGSSTDHSSNPTVLFDIFCRVGGAGAGKASLCLEVNSNNVIGDHFWLWRADHGDGVAWDLNTAKNGVIVNGSNVTFYGLFCEHFNEYCTIWNGNGGRNYFYQCEIPYDVPSQNAWMSENGTVNGFAGYKVGDSVTAHEAWGLGVYSYFRDAPVKLNSAIAVPVNPGVKIHHACSVWLSGNAASEITHVINNTGAAAVQGANMRQTVAEYP